MTLKKQLEADLAEARRRLQRATFNNDRLMVEAFSLYIDALVRTLHELEENYRAQTS